MDHLKKYIMFAYLLLAFQGLQNDSAFSKNFQITKTVLET